MLANGIFVAESGMRRSNAGRQALEFHNRALVCTQTEAAAHRFARAICGG